MKRSLSINMMRFHPVILLEVNYRQFHYRMLPDTDLSRELPPGDENESAAEILELVDVAPKTEALFEDILAQDREDSGPHTIVCREPFVAIAGTT